MKIHYSRFGDSTLNTGHKNSKQRFHVEHKPNQIIYITIGIESWTWYSLQSPDAPFYQGNIQSVQVRLSPTWKMIRSKHNPASTTFMLHILEVVGDIRHKNTNSSGQKEYTCPSTAYTS